MSHYGSLRGGDGFGIQYILIPKWCLCSDFFFCSEGLRVFFRGYIPNLLGILPYAGIDLTVYETLKRKYLMQYHQDSGSPPAISLLCFGTFSSCCGQVAAYPLALVRTKLQSQGWQFYLFADFLAILGVKNRPLMHINNNPHMVEASRSRSKDIADVAKTLPS